MSTSAKLHHLDDCATVGLCGEFYQAIDLWTQEFLRDPCREKLVWRVNLDSPLFSQLVPASPLVRTTLPSLNDRAVDACLRLNCRFLDGQAVLQASVAERVDRPDRAQDAAAAGVFEKPHEANRSPFRCGELCKREGG
jgi:hypothetical protein